MKALYDSSLGGALTELTDRLERIYSGESLGIPTGFKDLDSLISGLEPGALYVLGARPSMGKTALALNIAAHVALSYRPVLMFSLEMAQLELVQRMACAEARVDASHFKAGNMSEKDWAKVSHIYARLFDAPIWVEDNSGISIKEMRKGATELKEAVGDLGLIVVDYLQLMSGNGESRQLEISTISRELKIMARELECPVLALSQLNRGLEQRVDKRPMMADLRESGAIEQDADVIIFIYRDEQYDPDSEDKGTAEIIVSKQRNGPTGAVRLAYQGALTRFEDLAKTPKSTSKGKR